MPIFSLEALDASSGDCLLLHYGDPDAPRMMLIDGGFVGTYDDVLTKRLDEMRTEALLADDEALAIEHVVVTHIDHDHIAGVARMFRDLRDGRSRNPFPLAVGGLWHNSFADVLEATTGNPTVPANAGRGSGARTSSVAQGRELRDYAVTLGLDGNAPFGGLVMAPRVVSFQGGLTVNLVGPTQARLDKLKEDWENDVVPADSEARTSAFVDDEAPNLSSIAMHVTFGTRSMLLTGDARGDDTLKGLENAGLTDIDGRCPVELLKIPHHGSVRNVEPSYFERIPAEQYVISANGRHGNPDEPMLQMLVDTQGNRAYKIYLTNESNTTDFFTRDRDRNQRNYEVIVRDNADHSVIVDLDEALV